MRVLEVVLERRQLWRPNVDEWLMLMVSLHGQSIPVRSATTGDRNAIPRTIG
jgi:hypothetical protein